MRYAELITKLKGTLLQKAPWAGNGSAQGGKARFFGWLYKKLASVEFSIYVMWAFVLVFIIGTIFPQGEKLDDYIKDGGKFINLVISFDLLDLFTAPGFIALSAFLLLNLAVCVWDRYKALFSPRRFAKTFTPDKTLTLAGAVAHAHTAVRGVFKEDFGFKLASKDGEWIVMEKGVLSPRLLTWAYHACLLICLMGAGATYLFAFEDSMTIYPGADKGITAKTPGRVQRLWEKEHVEKDFTVRLDEFSPEYFQRPKLDYPKDKASRLAVGLGWKTPGYTVKDDSMTPKAWKSKIRIIKGGRAVVSETIDVNDPLRYGGYTFYQEGYEQKFKIRLFNSPMAIEAKADEEVFIPGIETPLKFGSVKTGMLYKIDGSSEKIIPISKISQKTKQSADSSEGFTESGSITVGGSTVIDGVRLTLADIDEAAVISYRYDPGFALVWWGGAAVVILMCLRFYSGFYTAAYNVAEAGGAVSVSFFVSAKGLGADKQRMVDTLANRLSAMTSAYTAPLDRS